MSVQTMAAIDPWSQRPVWFLLAVVAVQAVVLFGLWNRGSTNLQLILKHDSQIRAINSLGRIEEQLMEQNRLLREFMATEEDNGSGSVQGSHQQ